MPPLEDLRRHVHLGLVNEHPVLDTPRPFPPGIVPVGGMHLRPANSSNVPTVSTTAAWSTATNSVL